MTPPVRIQLLSNGLGASLNWLQWMWKVRVENLGVSGAKSGRLDVKSFLPITTESVQRKHNAMDRNPWVDQLASWFSMESLPGNATQQHISQSLKKTWAQQPCHKGFWGIAKVIPFLSCGNLGIPHVIAIYIRSKSSGKVSPCWPTSHGKCFRNALSEVFPRDDIWQEIICTSWRNISRWICL